MKSIKKFGSVIVASFFMVSSVALEAKPFSYYVRMTREFLYNFGCSDCDTVPIKKMGRYKSKPGWVVRAYRDSSGIYLNEEVFAQESVGSNLFTCAHEAAHHRFHKPGYVSLQIEREADTKAAKMLCDFGYTWVLQDKIDDFQELIEDGSGNWCDGKHPTVRERRAYLKKILERYL